jgi:hypothetical protein
MTSPEMRQSYEGPKLPPERAWLMIGYQRLIALARHRLPLTISPDGNPSPQEDWRVIRAAFLARIARTTEALSALVPLGARLDAICIRLPPRVARPSSRRRVSRPAATGFSRR